MKKQAVSPERFFQDQLAIYEKQSRQIQKQIRKTSAFRILSFLATITGIYLAASYTSGVVIAVSLTGFSVFGFFVYRHIRLFQKKKLTDKLLKINRTEWQLLHLDTSGQPDGTVFQDAAHPFAADLDVFGQRSLYQLLHRCATRPGSQLLAHTLLYPLQQPGEIIRRQKAIAELSEKPLWRQAFRAAGPDEENESNSVTGLYRWATHETHFDRPFLRAAIVITPLAGFSILFLTLAGSLPPIILLLFLLWPFSILGPNTSAINRAYDLLGRKTSLLQQYAKLFEKLENESFRSEIMQQATQTLTQGKQSAYAAVKKLSDITKAFDYRLNFLTGFFLNSFFLWDLWQSIRVERWKKQYSSSLQEWFNTLAQVDMLCSLAGFAFQHPEAVFPRPVNSNFQWAGEALKHPFIPAEKCVGNPVDITGEGKFLIITGANMAGKSTYLRTAGINLLLAMTGAPVLADKLDFTPIQLFTGIKTTDSLQDGESYFFAELKRLKEIIVRLEKGERMFIILDEILRGTNSKDKQKGSKALLRQLIRLKASGMIATHDLALGKLADEFPQNIVNKRFEVEIKDNQLQFDYLLKDGVAENMNATFLMKKMGITL
ncbi:hypothetical protein LA303_12880 [Candidatus Sulfidibacterium hydrothermale]|uniref:MutS-related protein n=1 Tax=Candidatus Sulfidibacterium hydrothermale TaxID=2875962 RepID=UPI001F0ADD35|nr:hypothetical protein [Candidatus Sulfidibacterium hydrothermale]UBM62276.1 hypothetical protein LA303_12880 [Candidatus Sulfidibacterium hydrothermale]